MTRNMLLAAKPAYPDQRGDHRRAQIDPHNNLKGSQQSSGLADVEYVVEPGEKWAAYNQGSDTFCFKRKELEAANHDEEEGESVTQQSYSD